MSLKILGIIIFLGTSIAYASNQSDINTENKKVRIYFPNAIVDGGNSQNENLTLRIFDMSRGSDAVLVLNSNTPEGSISITKNSHLIASMSYNNPSNGYHWQCNQRFFLGAQITSYDLFFKADTLSFKGNEATPNRINMAKCELEVKPHLLFESNLIEIPQKTKNVVTQTLENYLLNENYKSKIMLVGSGHEYDSMRTDGHLYFQIDIDRYHEPDLVYNLQQPLPESYKEKFDIVEFEYIPLLYINDLAEFIENSFSAVKPGGKLVILPLNIIPFNEVEFKIPLEKLKYDEIIKDKLYYIKGKKENNNSSDDRYRERFIFLVKEDKNEIKDTKTRNKLINECLEKYKNEIINYYGKNILFKINDLVENVNILNLMDAKQYSFKKVTLNNFVLEITKKGSESENRIMENSTKNNQILQKNERRIEMNSMLKQFQEQYKVFTDFKNILDKLQLNEKNIVEEKFYAFFVATEENPSTSLIRDLAVWAQLTQYQTIKVLNALRENPGMEYESFKKLLQEERNIAKVILKNPAFLVTPQILQTQENWQIQMLQRKVEEINYKLFTKGYIVLKDEQDIKGKIIFKDPPVFNILEQKAISLLNDGEKIDQVLDKLKVYEAFNLKTNFLAISFLSAQRKMSYFNRFLSDFDGSIIALGRQTKEDFHNSEDVYTVDITAPADLVANAFDLGTAKYFWQNSIDMNRKFKFVLFERIGLGWLSKDTVGTPHNSAQSVHELLKTYADCLENDGYIIILGGGGERPSNEELIKIKNVLDELKKDNEAHIDGYDIIPTDESNALNNMKEKSNSLNGNWDKVFPPKTEITWSTYVIFIKKSKN